MRGDRVLRSQSPQIRLGLFKNRTVVAVWLLILAGVLTAVEPLTQLYERFGIALGLYAPLASASLLGDQTAYVALACGAGLITLGVLAGYRNVLAMLAGAAVLGLDFVFYAGAAAWSHMSPETLFPIIVTAIVRYIFVRRILRGAYAVKLYDTLAGEMRRADAEYDAERRARPPSTEEGEFQG